MTVDQANKIADNCSVYVHVYEGYSGHGMYGAACVGLIVDEPIDLLAVGFAAHEIGIDASDLPRRIDSLGRSIIVY